MCMANTLRASIQNVEGDRVTLVFPDGQLLVVSESACEGKPKLGLAVAVGLTVLGSEDAGRQSLARELLNEILLP